jgi:hypothetical protein
VAIDPANRWIAAASGMDASAVGVNAVSIASLNRNACLVSCALNAVHLLWKWMRTNLTSIV